MGHDPILFLGSNVWFRPVIILSDCWKEFGYGSIIYLSSIPSLPRRYLLYHYFHL